MTWDISLLKKTGKTDELTPPDEDDLTPPPPDEMATHTLYESMLDEPVEPGEPTMLERTEYDNQGLIHPGDLPKIRQSMARGLYSLTGFLDDPDPWPVDQE